MFLSAHEEFHVRALIWRFLVISLWVSFAGAQDVVTEVQGPDLQEQTQPTKDSTVQKQDQPQQKMDMPGMDMAQHARIGCPRPTTLRARDGSLRRRLGIFG